MTNHVTIVGSLNVDTTMKVKRMPLPGETIAALSKTNAAGGKGANQAVAAARSGAETAFVGQVGDDAGGKMMINDLKNNNVDTTGITLTIKQALDLQPSCLMKVVKTVS